MPTFQCQNPNRCPRIFTVSDAHVGRKANCPDCGFRNTVYANGHAPPISEDLDFELDFESEYEPEQSRSSYSSYTPKKPPAPKQLFCTNCGKTVSEQALACTGCGAAPVGHRKFCRHCGAGLNPEQIICIKCGRGIENGKGSSLKPNDIKAQLTGFGTGGITILVATVLAFFSFFMPWVDAGPLGTENAFKGTFLFGLVFVYPVRMVLARKTINPVGGHLCAAIGIGLGLIHIVRCQERMMPGMGSINFAGSGVYLFICTCIALIVGIVLYRRSFNQT